MVIEEGRHPGKTRGRSTIISGLLVILLIAGGYLLYGFELFGNLKAYLESHIHPALFIAMMAMLPVVGAPISPFLLLVGMKFGVLAGILLSALLMGFHMAVTYYFVNSLLRERICRLLQRHNVSAPTILTNYATWQAVVFMLIPGVPYVLKNNLLALAGYRFAPYMAITWATQYGRGIPVIVLGGAVIEMDLTILGVALLLLLMAYFLQRYVRKRFLAKGDNGLQ